MEDFDEFSNFCLALKFQIPDEDDPTQSLEFIEQGIDHFLKNSFTKEQIDFFSGFLYEIVTEIWGRANFAKEAIQRINQFFQKCLDFIASRIQEENVVIFEILNKILESPVRTGFYQNESGNNRIIKIELDKYKSKDSQNESSHSSPQTEKDKQESKETQSQNNEPEFISSTYRFVSPLLLENIEYFGKIGGFRKIISQILGNDYEVSVFRIQSLIQPIIKCSRIFNEQFLGLILPDIQKILGLILDLDFNQLRNENRKELDSLVDSVELFTRRINSKAADEMRERFNLKLSLKYLISPFLETRVMGINDLSSLTTHVMGNIVDNSTHYFYKSFEWLNTENLIDWIEEEKIVDLLINERMHPEILKRSGSIFEFLAKYDKLTMNQFEKIWSYADGSHKSTTEIIYSLFSNILNYISSGNLKELFGKTIAKIQKWEEYSISLLRDFTFYELIKSNEDIDQTSGLNKIWELIKSKELEIETKKSIIQVFQQIFTRKECTEKIKETILIKSLNDIQSNPIIHLKLIQNIIDTYPLKSSMKFYYTHEDRESLIKKLQSSLKILDLLTDELLDFKKQFENLQSQNQFSIPKSQSKESMNLIKMEQHDYNYNIAIRFDLLKTIISDLIQFSSEQIEKLWQSFVENPRDEMEMDLFFQFLISIKFSNQFVSVLFQKAEKLNPETMTPKGFQFFQHFCYQINLIEKIIDGSDANFQVKDIMTSNEFGIESLWKIALLSKDPDVKKLSANFLIQFQIFRYDIILKEEEKVKERREQFISKCINYLSDNKNPNVQNRTIDILTAFIEKIEQTTINADSTKKINQDIPVSLNLKITNLDEKTEETTMVVYGNQTVKEFRNELAKLLDVPLTSFTVSHPLIQKKHDLLTLEDVGLYVAPIKELAIKILRRSDSKPKIKEIHSQDNSSIQIKKENLPSFLLSKYFDKLFQFLAIKEHGTAAKIWNLLMKMPKDKGFLLSFYQLCEDRQEYPEWKQKLQSLDCSYKLIYGLQIIQQFLEYPESVTQELGKEVDRQKWIQTFIRVDGVEYLVKNLVDIPLDQDKDDHECFEFQKSTALILKMIYQLLVNEDSKFRTDIQIKNFSIGIILNKLIDLTIKFGSTESKQTSEESVNLINDIVSYSVKIIVQGCLTEQEEWRNSLKRYPEISIWLKRSLVDSPVNSVREILANGIIKISKNDIDSSPQKNRERQDEEPFRIFFLKNLMKFMEEILDIEPKPEKHDHIIYYEQYFKVVQELINLGYTSNDKMELKNLVYQMIQVIKTYPITEKENSTDKEADERLIGQFNLIRTITSHEKSLKMEIEQKEMVIEELFNQFLFGIPQMQPNQTDIQMHEVTPPKCKAPKTRKACFELVCELSRDCFDNFKAIMSLLNQKHSKFEDMDTWNYSPQYYSQSSTGYRGLTNLGATCYMNSLLQQLFMIQEFRDAILTLDFEKENEKEKNLEKKTIPNEDKISYQLQRIFWYLTKTELGFVNTKLLCNTFKDWENKPLRTSVQMDAEEFLNILFNNLETEISDKEQKNILRDLFRGTFINQVIPY
ncbi:ubiquitin carboxyl-terminal hydrolase 34 [Anaeramoeba ignava]|uniref:Ubiquitin carboxyl-terminal hydrolase 34 n=1 Tax=Anaeramoeba ignava TaxID=1746090 RepID=A0A9Q0LV93_ANAIG|nr:ubiquitin carboxyl-terminal hydrolase 34 [Anaeramoeba ignava]